MLVNYHGLPRTGRAHRALADAEMPAALLARMQHDLRTQWRVMDPNCALLQVVKPCWRVIPVLASARVRNKYCKNNSCLRIPHKR